MTGLRCGCGAAIDCTYPKCKEGVEMSKSVVQMLRDAIHDGCLCIAQYGEQPPDCLLEALAATADLKDVILCHAEPVAYRTWYDEDNRARWLFTLWPQEERLDVEWEPIYRAWEPKP